MTEEEHAAAIAQLNDYHRCRINGSWVLTPGVQALDAAVLASAIEAVSTFQAFDEGDDPYGERDFGAFEIGGARFIWKIDYYDLEAGRFPPISRVGRLRLRPMFTGSGLAACVQAWPQESPCSYCMPPSWR